MSHPSSEAGLSCWNKSLEPHWALDKFDTSVLKNLVSVLSDWPFSHASTAFKVTFPKNRWMERSCGALFQSAKTVYSLEAICLVRNRLFLTVRGYRLSQEHREGTTFAPRTFAPLRIHHCPYCCFMADKQFLPWDLVGDKYPVLSESGRWLLSPKHFLYPNRYTYSNW